MIGGVEKQIGQNLPIGAGVAVDDNAGHVHRQRDRCLLQNRPQAGDDLLGRLAQIEWPALGVRAVHRDLLEGLDQFAGAMQVRHQLMGGVTRSPDEFLELRPAQRLVGFEFLLEHLRPARRGSTLP